MSSQIRAVQEMDAQDVLNLEILKTVTLKRIRTSRGGMCILDEVGGWNGGITGETKNTGSICIMFEMMFLLSMSLDV